MALESLSAFVELPVAVWKRLFADEKTPPMSPLAYEVTAERRPCPASAARLGSLSLPSVEYYISVPRLMFCDVKAKGGSLRCKEDLDAGRVVSADALNRPLYGYTYRVRIQSDKTAVKRQFQILDTGL